MCVLNMVVMDLGEGRFAPREIVLGAESDQGIEVLEGLHEGERMLHERREGRPHPEARPPHPERPGPAAEELHNEVRRLRREMEEMRAHLRELTERQRGRDR